MTGCLFLCIFWLMMVIPSLSRCPIAFFLRPLVMSNLCTSILSCSIFPSIQTSSSLSTPGFSHGHTWLRFDLVFFVSKTSSSSSSISSSPSTFSTALAFRALFSASLAALASSWAFFRDSVIYKIKHHKSSNGMPSASAMPHILFSNDLHKVDTLTLKKFPDWNYSPTLST